MSTALTIKSLFPLTAEPQLALAKSKAKDVTFVGIDFGTSTTVVSIALLKEQAEPVQVETIEIRQRYLDGSTMSSYKVPSIIAWKNEKLLSSEGTSHLKHYLKDGINLWYSKRPSK